MASPFSIFRKHQRAMIAAVAILCMIAFTIGGAISFDWMGSQSHNQNPVVAHTADNVLRESDILAMVRARDLVNEFLQATAVAAFGEQAPMMMYFRFGVQYDQQFGQPTETSVVETHLLAARAEELGVVISDKAINEFLRERSDDKVPTSDFRGILKQLSATQPQLFDALRTELAARKLGEMVLTNVQMTPAQRWDYYLRLHNRATAEVLPIRVENFIDLVEDPSEATLQRFFAEHKDTEPRPGSPEPGFKVPKKAAFEYFKADYEQFLAEASAQINDEEISKYYEEHKDQEFLFTDLADSPSTAEREPIAEKEEGAEEGSNDDADGTKEDEPGAREDPATPDETDGSADGADARVSDEEEDPAPIDEAGAAESGTDGEPPASDDESGDAAAAPDSDEQSSRVPAPSSAASSTLLAVADTGLELALADASDAQDSETSASGPQGDATDANQTATASDDGKSDGDSADGDSADGDPAESDAATGAEEADANQAGEKKLDIKPAPPEISDDLLLERDIRQGAKPKYDPLWKVEGSIRKRLAAQRATEDIEKALGDVRISLQSYARAWNVWSVEPEGTSHPKRPDFAALAQAHGLTAHETPLLAAFELAERYRDLAQADVVRPGAGGSQNFVSVGFSENFPLFKTDTSQDAEGNRYLFWKEEENESYVPKLDEVEDEVVHAWKLIQARRLALEDAQTQVEKARSKKQSLAKVFGPQDVISTGPFSWMTGGSAGNFGSREPPRLSEVSGVEDPGHEFMRTVFRLDVGEVGAALNQPQTVVYVVRVTELQPPRQLLRDMYMAEQFRSYAPVAMEDQQQTYRSWMDGIKSEAQLVWERPPDESRLR